MIVTTTSSIEGGSEVKQEVRLVEEGVWRGPDRRARLDS